MLHKGGFAAKAPFETIKHLGLILFDPSTGVYGIYYQHGISQRWDWADKFENNFSIVPEPNGKALYYSFNSKNEPTTPSATLKCKVST